MLRFLFWNQRRQDLSDVVAEAASTLRPDIFVFCETGASSARTLAALRVVGKYHFTTGRIGKRFHVFTRFHNRYIQVRREAERYLIFEVALPARDRFLLMVLHGPSKSVGWTPTSLAMEISHYAGALRHAEAELKLSRSVIVGDFNMNPFEPGMVGAGAFNAVMDARQARKGKCVVQRREYRYLYNPMWNLLGDRTPGPPASLFYNGNTHDELLWHMVDQVIVSPEMIDYLDVASLRILDSIGGIVLTTPQGRPRSAKFSDHLPIYFELTV